MHNGFLRDLVQRDYITPRGIAIFVDNEGSDVRVPKSQGIDSYYYKSCHEIGAPYRPKLLGSLFSSLYSGIINVHFHAGDEKYSPDYEYGFLRAPFEKDFPDNINKEESEKGRCDFMLYFKAANKEFEISDAEREKLKNFYH